MPFTVTVHERLRGVDTGTRRMLWSTFSLLASTAITSLLGFLYWVLAAHVAPIHQVGYASAIVSAMTLLLNVGQFGFGTMLLAEAARGERRMGELIAASLVVATSMATAVTAVFVLVARSFDTTLGGSVGGWAGALGLIAGVAVGAPGLVLDEAVIGMHLGSVQLVRNIVFSVSKLVFCWAAAAAVEYATLGTIVWAWVAGSAVSLLTTAVDLRRRGRGVFFVPRLSALRGLGMRTFDHNTINLAQMAPRLGIPLLAATVLDESDNAAFFAAWMIASFLYMVPTHLSTAMFAVAVGDVRSLVPRLRTGAALTLGPGVVAAVVCALFSDTWLSMFGEGYRVADSGLELLSAAYLPCVVKQFYIAVQRVRDKLRTAGIVLAVAAASETGGAVVGGVLGGIDGLCLGYLIASTLPCLVYAAPVVRSLFTGDRSTGTAEPTDSHPLQEHMTEESR